MTVEQRAALEAVVSIDKGVMHGTPCFSGTRVPVQTLIDFLETGKTVDESSGSTHEFRARRSCPFWS
jgi:uncharacterized protein (DUF433 family)